MEVPSFDEISFAAFGAGVVLSETVVDFLSLARTGTFFDSGAKSGGGWGGSFGSTLGTAAGAGVGVSTSVIGAGRRCAVVKRSKTASDTLSVRFMVTSCEKLPMSARRQIERA